jgi:cyclopropane fatty-acyl-phospholipid synthase-like methyltransferase
MDSFNHREHKEDRNRNKRMNEVASNWYENFFHGLALDLWRKAISPEQTKTEADFLVKVLQCEKGSHLLDVPCGNGRLSLALAARGYRLTGVDISEEFVDEARGAATALSSTQPEPPVAAAGAHKSRKQSVVTHAQADFILGDMSRVEGKAIYDGAYCFGNSFGFLDYANMESFLSGVARALKPGARFIVETGMAAESVLQKFEPLTVHQIDDISITIKERYLAEESCIDTEYIVEQDGKIESGYAKHWIYTVAEIRRMLERAGFEILNLYGSLKCEPYTLGAEELFVIAQRMGAVARP